MRGIGAPPHRPAEEGVSRCRCCLGSASGLQCRAHLLGSVLPLQHQAGTRTCTSPPTHVHPPLHHTSCAVYYGAIGPTNPALLAPVTLPAGACQLSYDTPAGMFFIGASRGDKVAFVWGLVHRIIQVPAVPNPDA